MILTDHKSVEFTPTKTSFNSPRKLHSSLGYPNSHPNIILLGDRLPYTFYYLWQFTYKNMSSIDISRTSPPSGVHTVIAHSQSQPCIIKVKSRQSLKPSYCRLELPGATGDHIRKQSGIKINSHRPAAATIIPCRRFSHWLRTDPRLLAATNYTLLNAAHKSRETQLPTIPQVPG